MVPRTAAQPVRRYELRLDRHERPQQARHARRAPETGRQTRVCRPSQAGHRRSRRRKRQIRLSRINRDRARGARVCPARPVSPESLCMRPRLSAIRRTPPRGHASAPDAPRTMPMPDGVSGIVDSSLYPSKNNASVSNLQWELFCDEAPRGRFEFHCRRTATCRMSRASTGLSRGSH